MIPRVIRSKDASRRAGAFLYNLKRPTDTSPIKVPNWFTRTKNYVKEQGDILKETMVCASTINYTVPLLSKRVSHTLSLSDLSGHASFLLLMISYLETDFLHLRMFAASGVFLSIIFQYYREKPLWIPIRWNALFLLINLTMIFMILKEIEDANNIPAEKKVMYEAFERKGMKPVDFMLLINAAKKIEVKQGEEIVSEQIKNTRVFFVKSGELSVIKNGSKIRTVEANQFSGEMSFLRWADRLDSSIYTKKHIKAAKREYSSKDIDMELFLPLLVIMEQLLDRWNIRPQNDVGDIDVSASMTSQKIVRDDTYGFTVDSNGNVIAHDQQRDRDFDEPLQEQTAFGRVLNSTYSFVGALFNPSQNNSDDANAPGGGPNDGEFAAATVVAEKDCVVYYWSFKRLRSLMEQYPTMGLAFERLMSGDLNKKMVTTMQVEPVQRYQLLISAALMDGEPSEYSKTTLANFRKQHNMTMDDHASVLAKFGWSVQDFDAGFKGAAPPAVHAKYLRMLQIALANTDAAPLADDKRTELRVFRLKNGINSSGHLAALRRIGWSVDEYEIGSKNPTHATLKESHAIAANERAKRMRQIRSTIFSYFFFNESSNEEQRGVALTEEAS